MKIRMKENYCSLEKDGVYELLHKCSDDNIYIVLNSSQYAVHVSNTRCELIEELPVEPLIKQIKCEQQPTQYYPSRRDYFAAHALNGSDPSFVDINVRIAIQYADEMIKQLDESEKK